MPAEAVDEEDLLGDVKVSDCCPVKRREAAVCVMCSPCVPYCRRRESFRTCQSSLERTSEQ